MHDYKQYLEKRKNGISKTDAKVLGSSNNIHESIMTKWSFDDVDEICRELDRAGFLNCNYADNVVYLASLSDKGIIYMENRFKTGLSEVLNYINTIKSIINPFG